MNALMLLEMAADGMPGRVAVGGRADGASYAELLDRARHIGSAVAAGRSQRVVYVGTNGADVPVLLYASAVAGVPFVPLNYRLADDRLRSLCARTAPAVVAARGDDLERVAGIDGIRSVPIGALDTLGGGDTDGVSLDVDPDGVAIWLFTSGTTGEPKAAVLRHRHLVAYVLGTVEFMSAEEDEATLVSVPPYHIAGMATILSNTYAGRRIVYLEQFDAEEWVRTAEAEAVTHAMVVPTMLGRILDAADELGATLPALRHVSYGGGRMPVPIIERAMSRLRHVGFVNAYGLTETSSTISVLGPQDHRDAIVSDDPVIYARLGSVGRPLPGLDLEIRGPGGEPVPVGEAGEIWVRGEQIGGEYDGRSVLTADGWFRTNDGGHLDDGGFLFVDGRLDDVIVRGGENMAPGEIEDVLVQHAAVAEAAVTGVADDEWGEAVAAAVVLEPGAAVTKEELREWVRVHLRSTRVPAVIDVRTALPYSETGKLLRRVLRAEIEAVRANR